MLSGETPMPRKSRRYRAISRRSSGAPQGSEASSRRPAYSLSTLRVSRAHVENGKQPLSTIFVRKSYLQPLCGAVSAAREGTARGAGGSESCCWTK